MAVVGAVDVVAELIMLVPDSVFKLVVLYMRFLVWCCFKLSPPSRLSSSPLFIKIVFRIFISLLFCFVYRDYSNV